MLRIDELRNTITTGIQELAENYHTPVLLSECMEALAIKSNGTYVDVTYGGGGHSRVLLKALDDGGRLYAFDKDGDTGAGEQDSRLTLIRSDFRYLRNWMRYYGVKAIDGLIADLGVSSHQLDDASRGFTFREDVLLDMRMNTSARTTAADIVNNYDEERLADVIYTYGELKNARRLAAAIVEQRAKKPITTTGQLYAATEQLMPRERLKKDMARLFQALRIEVNGEMDALRRMLTVAVELLSSGGRLTIISYHSLEDRMVKNMIRSGNAEGRTIKDFYGNGYAPLKAIGRVITPSREEQTMNPRSRSAKLRVAEKVNN